MIMSNAEQFQSQLSLYVPLYSPDYWPAWLLLAGLAICAMLAILATHAFLRFKLNPHHVTKEITDKHRIYLYSRSIRLWHWSNALLFILLLISGLTNHFTLFSPAVTANMVAIHRICGFLLIICWLAYLLINAFGGNGHHYLIERKGWINRAVKQTRFYLFGIMKGESHPFPANERSKFNPLQQVAYLGVMYCLVPLLLISGLLMLYPEVIGQMATGIRYWMLQIHFGLAIISLFFIVGHLYLCTTGRIITETFKCMVDGYHRH